MLEKASIPVVVDAEAPGTFTSFVATRSEVREIVTA
jgi:hypothetical protein